MAYDVKEANCWPVNELGEIVSQSGIGSNNIVGYIPSSSIPIDPESKKVILVNSPPKAFQAPYRLASFGDSRANVNSSTYDVSGTIQSLSPTKSPSHTAALRGDTELVYNFGVSGDLAANWNLANRNAVTTKQLATLVSLGVDLVHVQYGVNDILTGNGTTPSASTICGYLKGLCFELMKSGMQVAFESILPCTAAGWVSLGSGTAAQKQAIADSVNATMQAWVASFPVCMIFVDTATSLKDSTGFAKTALYIDQIHLNNKGAYLCGGMVAEASFKLLPKKNALYYPSGLQTGANFIDSIAPPITTILSGVAGTFTLNNQTVGYNAIGQYVEFSITANTLASGEATFWAAIGGDVGSFAVASKYSVAAGDVLQGQCRMVIDDGFGGVPSGVSNLVVRQRCYYQAGGGIYSDFGANSNPSGFPAYTSIVNELCTTPRIITTVASSGIEAPTHAKGYGLHIFVSLLQVGTPVRIRVYSPSLRKAA